MPSGLTIAPADDNGVSMAQQRLRELGFYGHSKSSTSRSPLRLCPTV